MSSSGRPIAAAHTREAIDPIALKRSALPFGGALFYARGTSEKPPAPASIAFRALIALRGSGFYAMLNPKGTPGRTGNSPAREP